MVTDMFFVTELPILMEDIPSIPKFVPELMTAMEDLSLVGKELSCSKLIEDPSIDAEEPCRTVRADPADFTYTESVASVPIDIVPLVFPDTVA